MKRRAKVLRMRRIGAGPMYGRGWCSWIYCDSSHFLNGTFSTHPTHAAALAHALAEVGLTKKNTKKEQNR